ncbi:MAG TPA: hypothetical protein VN611_18030 [Patescibacteria group bacterium]|nr:hypothetical protein [Patescibacteria group bacterium]
MNEQQTETPTGCGMNIEADVLLAHLEAVTERLQDAEELLAVSTAQVRIYQQEIIPQYWEQAKKAQRKFERREAVMAAVKIIIQKSEYWPGPEKCLWLKEIKDLAQLVEQMEGGFVR